jgi:hypothetical protein
VYQSVSDKHRSVDADVRLLCARGVRPGRFHAA